MIIIAILAIIFGIFVIWISLGIINPNVKEQFYKSHPELSESFINNVSFITGIIGFVLLICGIFILIFI